MYFTVCGPLANPRDVVGNWAPQDLQWLALYPAGTQMNQPLETLGVLGPLGPWALLTPAGLLMTPPRGAPSDTKVECHSIDMEWQGVDWSRGTGRLRADSLASLQ